MPTSVICLRSKRRPPRRTGKRQRDAGFTLVELLVVLLIMGLLASVMAPNLQHLYSSVQHDAEREQALGAITGLSYRAYVTGQPITLAKGRAALNIAKPETRSTTAVAPVADDSVFPAGWQIDVAEPIAINFLGICSGGKVRLVSPDGAEETIVLKGPRCDVALPPDTL